MVDISVWRSPRVAVAESAIGGLGLFAVEPLAEGEAVAVKVGHVVGTEEVLRLTDEVGDFSLQVHDDLFLAPRHRDEVDEIVVMINHSCDANVGFDGVVYVAMRSIEAGEELCHDYAMARTASYEMTCECGAVDCRKIVTGEDWRLPAVQGKYAGFFMPYVERKIRTGR